MEFKLRPWRRSDLRSLVRHANNYNIAKWVANTYPFPYGTDEGEEYLDLVVDENPVKTFAIEVEGEAAGSIGLIPLMDIREKSMELGYWLSEKYWGRGIASTAIEQMVEYAFRTFDINRITASIFAGNAASQRALEKAGFTLEARLKNAIFKNGEYFDELIYTRFRPA